ncbi:hypothetical protein CRYO30217_00875 [Parvicella tangerina]|uniref:Uncharacterized protein n=1 Tax=Parvicella tangerina TaxID=2829795 RepID=A0A916JKR3_9FLAO|nr:hypothetical protein CRYO30217_00875 [Parvicella tangerina]
MLKNRLRHIGLFLVMFTLVLQSFADSPPKLSEEEKDGVIILEGKYQHRNIFIAQALGSEGIGFCAYEIRVNGNLITDEINSSAFEIDLSPFNFEIGQDITIEIRHKMGCTPKVLNPGGLKPQPTFETVDISIDEAQILQWITENETGSLPFVIQQYKWNKWIDVGEVQGDGTPDISNYAFHVDFTSGKNKFRVAQVDQAGKIKTSDFVEIESNKPKLTFTYAKKNQEIVFSDETGYEIHDKYGDLMMKGYGSSVDITTLSKDNYWLSFDNCTESFVKK